MASIINPPYGLTQHSLDHTNLDISTIKCYSFTTPVSISGTTSTKVLCIHNIPQRLLTVGAVVNIKAMFSAGSSNNKTFQIALNDGLAGSSGASLIYSAGGIGLNGSLIFESNIIIRDYTTQISGIINSVAGNGTTPSQPVITDKNSANGLDVVLQGALGVSSDYMTMEFLFIKVNKP